MISFALLDKDDLKDLFEGFDTEFLSIPLKKPSKTLSKFILNGFRSGKMPRTYLVRMYCDAVSKNEPSICEYVTKEITRNFNERGISNFFTTLDISNSIATTLALTELTGILLENGFAIPAYTVLLLYGVECTPKMKEASKKLFFTHRSILEKTRDEAVRHGKEQAEVVFNSELEKNTKKYQKRVSTLEGQQKELQEKEADYKARIDELEESLGIAQEALKRATENNETLGIQVTALTNTRQTLLEELVVKKEQLSKYKDELGELSSVIVELRAELAHTKRTEYSDDVLRHLCADVLDELRASSLGNSEILNIAKKKFSEADTVVDAWVQLSSFSEEHIKQIVENITNPQVANTLLDEIEEIEDGILIKFAVLKALKSLLYNELEANEAKRTIAEKFTGEKE